MHKQSLPEPFVIVHKCHGGGDLFPRLFDVNFTNDGATIEAHTGDVDEPGDGLDPAIGFPYTVSSTDPEVFSVTTSGYCYCTWQMELDWVSGGESGSTPLQLNDGPFRTATEEVDGAGAEYTYWDNGSLETRSSG